MSYAVCDSGPLTHLWQIQQWSAFAVFSELHVANQVAVEVRDHVHLDEFTAMTNCQLTLHLVDQAALEKGWNLVGSSDQLQDADIATLMLALRLAPPFVLTDDLALRRALDELSLRPMGSVGLLLRAYAAALLTAEQLRQAIDNLFVHSTLYLSPLFRSFVQREVEKALRHR